MKNLSAILFAILLSLHAAPACPAEWVVIGAGNATCSHWSSANDQRRTEVLSWMAGFASAVNLNLAAEGRPELRLEYLTYEYLRGEIDAACSDKQAKAQSMSGILFVVLKKLPQQQ